LRHEQRTREAAEWATAREAERVDPQICLAVIGAGFREARAAQGKAWETPEVRKLLEDAREWLELAVIRFVVKGRVNEEQEECQGAGENQSHNQFTPLHERVSRMLRGVRAQ
jgi:hypothetical protein